MNYKQLKFKALQISVRNVFKMQLLHWLHRLCSLYIWLFVVALLYKLNNENVTNVLIKKFTILKIINNFFPP